MSAQLEELARQADNAAPRELGDEASNEPRADGEASGSAPQAEPPAPGNFEAIGFLLAAFTEVASMVLKVDSLRRTLGDREIEQCARVLAPVADKYGLQLGGFMGGPEAVALMTAGPILWGAWKQLDMELKARRAKPITPEPEASGQAAASPTDGDA
jgi:hypothetical protein